MQTIYQSTITRVGANAADALADQMMITFAEGAPEDLAAYCFIHSHGELSAALCAGVTLELAGRRYAVTAVGAVAEQNLRELGHITLRFDGAGEAEYPGCVHVAGDAPQQVVCGDDFKFVQ